MKQKGFTLVETVVAIFILSLSVGALIALSASGIFSVRYARNQIVADNLAQEALEYIRNTRDSAVINSVSWSDWLATLNVDSSNTQYPLTYPHACFTSNGCMVDPYTTSGIPITPCGSECPFTLFYPDYGFYGYNEQTTIYPLGFTTAPITTTYQRTITVALDSTGNQLTVTATITWKNGNLTKRISQSILLTNWSSS